MEVTAPFFSYYIYVVRVCKVVTWSDNSFAREKEPEENTSFLKHDVKFQRDFFPYTTQKNSQEEGA